jgi:membrane-associated phospholipid phosphatase
MLRQSMIFLTDFGDLAILLPLSAAVLVWLLWAGARGAAAWWIAALLLCVGGIGLLKIYFSACSTGPDPQNPSGHAGLAVLVYGALAAVTARAMQGRAGGAALGLGTALILGIAASRLALGAHSLIEVAAGLAIGLVALSLFLLFYRVRAVRSPLPLLLAAVFIVVLLHGRELHAEDFLHVLGFYLKTGTGVCN